MAMTDYPPPPPSASPPKLLDQVRDRVRRLGYAKRTEQSYVHWIKRYILFHGKRHPREMGKAEVEAFLTSLAVERNGCGFYPEPGVVGHSVLVPGGSGLAPAVAGRGDPGKKARPAADGADATGSADRVGAHGRDGGPDAAPALRHGNAIDGMRAAAREGRGFRHAPDHGARRQGWQGSGNDAAAISGCDAASASGPDQIGA